MTKDNKFKGPVKRPYIPQREGINEERREKGVDGGEGMKPKPPSKGK